MINRLITTLLYPDMGEYALRLNNALHSGELSLKMFSELITTLHRLSLCSYYEITDVVFGDVSCNYRYLDPGDLCDHGASFALLCLEKMVEDNKVEKQNSVVVREGCILNVREVIAELELTAEKLGDEDELTADWTNKLNVFILWTQDNNHDFRIELLDIINPSNANVIFGYCTRYGRISLPDKLKEYQAKNPEDFFTFKDIREYHAQRTHSVFCYIFLDRADSNEHGKVVTAQDKAEKALTIKELLLALTEEDIYLNIDITFPSTVYRILTDKTFDVQLKKVPTDCEILKDDRDIPDELKGVFASARNGNTEAQSELASRYLSGTMLPKDDYRAVYWLKLAAEGGDALAQTNYGVALQNGLGGLERDYTEAIEWFLKAAAKSEPVAQYNLGLAYAKGLGVERDLREMERWMKLSADGGYFMAQLILQNGLIIND